MGRHRTALSVHGELLLGMAGGSGAVVACRYGRAAAAGALRQAAGGAQLPKRHADVAASGVFLVRHDDTPPVARPVHPVGAGYAERSAQRRSEEHTSELQSLMRISYAVFCLKKKINKYTMSERITKLSKKTNQ